MGKKVGGIAVDGDCAPSRNIGSDVPPQIKILFSQNGAADALWATQTKCHWNTPALRTAKRLQRLAARGIFSQLLGIVS